MAAWFILGKVDSDIRISTHRSVLDCAMIRQFFSFFFITLLTAQAQAATYACATDAMRGNRWICKDDPSLCAFVFTVDENAKTMSRKPEEDEPRIQVIVNKWEEKQIIAHEDRQRLDSRFVEQYYYRINLETGEFKLANEYVTSSGRFLTQEDINAADPKRYSYYRPKLFAEMGRCRFNRSK